MICPLLTQSGHKVAGCQYFPWLPQLFPKQLNEYSSEQTVGWILMRIFGIIAGK
jgi:hypothetical protein